jgi:hypothetical protein
MEKNQLYKVTIVFPNGEIKKNEYFALEPYDGMQFLQDGVPYVVKYAVLNCFVTDDEKVVNYYTINVEEIKSQEMVGVTRVKFITPQSNSECAANLEEQLNKFLFETRHTHHIMNITYTNWFVVVEYRLRNYNDTETHKAREKSYQCNGKKIGFKLESDTEWFVNTHNIDY